MTQNFQNNFSTYTVNEILPFSSSLFFFYSCNDDDKLLDAPDSFGKTSLAVNNVHTPLHSAAANGNLKRMKNLLEKGIDIKYKSTIFELL